MPKKEKKQQSFRERERGTEGERGMETEREGRETEKRRPFIMSSRKAKKRVCLCFTLNCVHRKQK